MNLQQFLSQQSLDTLIHQFFSIEGQSQKSRTQSSTLINSIVLCIASSPNTTFSLLYQQCQYQLQVNNQQRQAVKKMCRLLVGVLSKASYLLRNVDVKYFVDEVLEFFLAKVFVTVCSADCIRCIWALVNAYTASNRNQQKVATQSDLKSGCCSGNNGKACCQANNSLNTQTMSDENHQQSNCIKQINHQSNSSCCQSTSSSTISSHILNHQRICRSLITKFLSDFKLHVKTYPFKVRKDILKLVNYVLKFVQISQRQLLLTIGKQHTKPQSQQMSRPLLVDIGATKHQLIQLVMKTLCDQKDPRNMTLTFQNYLLLIQQFSPQLKLFNLQKQVFQNIEVYYPLSMQGDQQDFKIDQEDLFNQYDLRQLLDQCLLQELFRSQVRQMLVQKMLAPPIHQYASLYVKYITKFNPNTYQFTSTVGMQQEREKYSILTMNLLNRLCEQQYLDQNYQQESCNDGGCGSGGCGSGNKKGSCQKFSIAQLISTIVKNVFLTPSSSNHIYLIYHRYCEQKYIEFLNTLIIHKLFNHQENNKHAGTIIEIVKTILNPDIRSSSAQMNKTVDNHSHEESCSEQGCGTVSSKNDKNEGGCCGGGGCGSGGCGSPSPTKKILPTLSPTQVSPTKLSYYQKINYQQILINFITLKFMQYWSAKGDVAFKLGILIIVMNKKLQIVSIQQFINSPSLSIDSSTQNMLQHLLISLGNVYQTHKTTDQIKIMVLKTLMIIASMFSKLYQQKQLQEKNLNKVRKINNSIIHKDCVRFSHLLSDKSEQSKNQNPFAKSQHHILKSYVDYLMEVYVDFRADSQILAKESQQMLENVFGQFGDDSAFNEMKQLERRVTYIDVKLYAAMRYLSIQASSKQQSANSLISQPIKLLLHILFSSSQQLTSKLLTLLKYYTYPVLIQLLSLLFRHISSLHNHCQNTQNLFVNIQLIGKILAEKFDQFYVVELQLGENYGRIIINDIKKCFQLSLVSGNATQNRLTKILLWYMFRKVWRRQLLNSLQISFADTQIKEEMSDQQKFAQNIYSATKQRISLFVKLYSNQNNLKQLTFDTHSHTLPDLQCSLLYIKYLKAHNEQYTLKFTKHLTQLYDPGMIEYFWNRLLNSMTYSQKNIISSETKQELIQLIEHLPQKILVFHAEQIAPIVIYDTFISGNRMIEESKEILERKDSFDYTRTELITKLAHNLPQSSLIMYVLPYCLNFLKIAALSCQKGISIPPQIIPTSQSIRTLFNINKIIHILLEKNQQKISQKVFKYQKLRKSLIETHKKEFNMYFSRLIYHKKRIIRQSSRNLLMSFE